MSQDCAKYLLYKGLDKLLLRKEQDKRLVAFSADREKGYEHNVITVSEPLHPL